MRNIFEIIYDRSLSYETKDAQIERVFYAIWDGAWKAADDAGCHGWDADHVAEDAAYVFQRKAEAAMAEMYDYSRRDDDGEPILRPVESKDTLIPDL